MTILNRRQFMQLLAASTVASTVDLPPLPDVGESAHSPSALMMRAGRQMVAGFVEGLNGLKVTDITTEAVATRFDFSTEWAREIPDWSTQIFTVRGVRSKAYDNATEQIEEEYQFLLESSEVPAGGWDNILEFVEDKLTSENRVRQSYRGIVEGIE